MRRRVKTAQAAKAVGINRVTLQLWIKEGRVKAPRTQLVNGRAVRLWSQTDIKRLRQVKKRTYRKGRGRKRKR